MNYFGELQEHIRGPSMEMRTGEANSFVGTVFYQKIKGIYTTSIDYNPKDENTILFYLFNLFLNPLLQFQRFKSKPFFPIIGIIYDEFKFSKGFVSV
jgi:hypothetical protein